MSMLSHPWSSTLGLPEEGGHSMEMEEIKGVHPKGMKDLFHAPSLGS
jgi:hypothetical protein